MNETGNSFITIDLAKIKSNMEKIRNHVGPDVEIMPVLKANACGHGLIRTSDWLRNAGLKDWLSPRYAKPNNCAGPAVRRKSWYSGAYR